MTRAIGYSRVSTEDQEREGTSLQTQSEAILRYAHDNTYELVYQFNEAYTGLSLDRPKLNELRELVRSRSVDVIIVYALDRLSRDPSHGVILQDELEKYHVKLEAVSEDVETSELGKLISYIRGFASKVEAEKIKERTARGRKARAQQGWIFTGGFSHIYGYDYKPRTKKQSGYRVINENEAEIVRKVFDWCVIDRLSTSAIVMKLRELNVPAKKGGVWRRSAVYNILTNPAFTGHTYAFTTANHKAFGADKSTWVELPGITPRIVSDELYEAAQERLQINKANSMRNTKREYLLRGRIRCSECGHTYLGRTSRPTKHNPYTDSRYTCGGKSKVRCPGVDCHNSSWKVDKIESLVWSKLEQIIRQPATIIDELKKQENDVTHLNNYERELQNVEKQLSALDREQQRLVQLALKELPENIYVAENRRINGQRDGLKSRKSDLEKRIRSGKETAINLTKIQDFLKLIQGKIENLDFDKKRLVLEALNIEVRVSGKKIHISGSIGDDIVTTQLDLTGHNIQQSIPFIISV